MFTVVHTADWHLGQSFFGYDRNYEHGRFLDWLFESLQQQQPDALLIAGDIFDSINPSIASQRLLYDFLRRTSSQLPQLQVVITAGNHDSGARLEVPAGLLESLNISVVGTVQRDRDGAIDYERFLVPLKDSSGVVQAIALAIPFLRPSDVPHLPGAEDPYLEGIAELYRMATSTALKQQQRQSIAVPLLAIGHCHVQGGEESPYSERRIVIGGAEALHPNVFPEDLSYVALGHLHKAQEFREGTIRYSGSPIPLSFAEKTYEHRVLKLSYNAGQLTNVADLMVPQAVPLLSVPDGDAKQLDEILPLLEAIDLPTTLSTEQQPFLEVRVLVDGPDPERRQRIEDAIKGKPIRLASIKREYPERDKAHSDGSQTMTISDLQSIDPWQVFANAWHEKYGTEPDASHRKAFQEIVLQDSSNS